MNTIDTNKAIRVATAEEAEQLKQAEIEREITRDKQLRRDIDTQIQLVKDLLPSRERSLCITKLQEAVMWLGMDLKRINDQHPGICSNP